MRARRTAHRTLTAAGRALAILLAGMACGAPVGGGEPAPAIAPVAPRPALNLMSMLSPAQLDEPVEPDGKTGQVVNGVLELRGRIDRALGQRFSEAVATGNVTAVRITSQGGDIVEALQMAMVMQSRGMDVIVHDLCVGACAQYIFVAGNKRRLEKDSLVGFMRTIKSSGTLLGMAADTLEVRNQAASPMGQLAAVEEELYRRRGVAASLLLDPHVALQPQCVVLKRSARSVGWSDTSTYFMWVPSRQYLKAAGVEFDGDWPKSHFTLGGLVYHYMHAGDSRYVRYGDNDHLRSKKQKPYALEDVRKCVLDELPPDPAPAADPPPG